MNTYRVASMDTAARISTAFYYLLTAGITTAGILRSDVRPLLAMTALLIVMAWISWQIAPRRYDVSEKAVVIVRAWPFRDIAIPLRDVREVRRIRLSPWRTVRTFGVGGLYGYAGRFWHRDLGGFYAGVTDLSRSVLISDARKYVISPEDPEQFVADMQSRMGAAASFEGDRWRRLARQSISKRPGTECSSARRVSSYGSYRYSRCS